MKKKIKKYCYRCNSETNQSVNLTDVEFGTREIFSSSGDSGWLVEQREWIVAKCMGCEAVNVKIRTTHIGKNDFKNVVSEEEFPNRVSRMPSPWIFSLNKERIELLSEIYKAFNSSSYRLAAMGIRALLDMLMTDAIGDIGPFSQKIDQFEKEGFINKLQKNMINTAVIAGSASMHRGYKPDKKTLNDLLDMAEHLMQTEVLEGNTEKINNIIPRRRVR